MKTKAMIKKILLISVLLISANLCLAAENIEIFMGNDYLVTADEKVKSVLVANPAIITLCPFFTIFNEKNTLSLHPQRIGKTTVTFCLEDSKEVFTFIVKAAKNKKDTKTLSEGCLEIMPLDAPPEMQQLQDLQELDAPPSVNDRVGV